MIKRTWMTGLLAITTLVYCPSVNYAADVFRLGLPAETSVEAVKLGQVPGEASIQKTCCFRGFRCGVVSSFPVVTTVTCLPPTIVTIPRVSFCAPVVFPRRIFWSACLPRVIVRTPIWSNFSLGVPPVVMGPSFSLSTPIPAAPPVIQSTNPPPVQLPFPKSEPAKPGSGPQQPPQQGTFDYDGGPRIPVPMPGLDPIPMKSKPTQALEGIPVLFESPKNSRYRYPAYGEKTETPKPVLRTVSR